MSYSWSMQQWCFIVKTQSKKDGLKFFKNLPLAFQKGKYQNLGQGMTDPLFQSGPKLPFSLVCDRLFTNYREDLVFLKNQYFLLSDSFPIIVPLLQIVIFLICYSRFQVPLVSTTSSEKMFSACLGTVFLCLGVKGQ